MPGSSLSVCGTSAKRQRGKTLFLEKSSVFADICGVCHPKLAKRGENIYLPEKAGEGRLLFGLRVKGISCVFGEKQAHCLLVSPFFRHCIFDVGNILVILTEFYVSQC